MRKLFLLFTINIILGINIFARVIADGQEPPKRGKDTLTVVSESDTADLHGESPAMATKEEVENVKGVVEGLNESFLETKSTLDALKKIKMSGYIQGQFQSAEVDGAGAAGSGGDFAKNMHNRFAIRRGRLKVTYDNDITQYVVQVNVDEKGIGLKDAYAAIRDPWTRIFGLTGGIFNRPFGFEVPFSSGDLESPERTRYNQILFPGEEDLGLQLDIAPVNGPLSNFYLKAGVFAGNGIAAETDNGKDFIGHFGFKFPFEDINLALDGGFSAYVGSVRVEDGKNIYKINSPTSFETDAVDKTADRAYYGADLQLYYDLPVLGGFTLRGEYVKGKNPGSSASNKPYTYASGNGDVYIRNLAAYYLTYVQNVGESIQLVLKYEDYDPNTDIRGDNITGAGASKLSSADIKFSTFGIGWNYFWDANVKFTLYYDMVANEKVNASAAAASLLPYKNDLKDNVVTFRMQIKF